MNVTGVLGANAIVTKGKYTDLDETFRSTAIPTILYTQRENDDTFIGIEKYSGIPLVWKQGSFVNYVIETASDNQRLVPLVYVERDFRWDQDLVDDKLSPLLSGIRWKWALFGALFITGLILFFIAVILLCQARRIKRRELRIAEYQQQLL